MSDIKSLFNWGGGKFGSKGGDELNEKLRESILKGIGDIEDIVMGYVLSDVQKNAIKTAKEIQDRLNENESNYPRRDPALQGLRTDQWKVYAYLNYDSNGKQKRKPNGQYDFKFRFVAINMQRPFYYTFDFLDYDSSYGGGKMLLQFPVSSLTDKERKKLRSKNVYNHLPDGYSQETKFVNTYKQSYKKSGKPMKVGSRAKHTVGNLAAVRLAQNGNIVRPVHARRIVFWVGHAKRLDSKGKATQGGRLQQGGYVFVTARRYNIGGHTKYKKAVDKIIDSEVNTFMDKLW